MNQVFISYKHNDEVDLFDLLVLRLQNTGYTVWTDKNLTPGETWTDSIDRAINDSFAVVVIMTKDAHQSQYVTYEWSYALGAGKQIVTLLVSDEVVLHPRLTNYQYSDFTKNKRPWEDILSGLERIRRETRETRQEQAFRWMQDGDAELEHEDFVSALDSYTNAYSLADERLRVRIGYKMARLYIRKIERLKDRDEKAELVEKAEQLLTDALQVRPTYHAARAYLAYIYRLKRDVVTGDDKQFEALEQARLNFKDALAHQPDLVDHRGESWWNTYGGILRRLGDITQQKAIASNSEYYDTAVDAYQTATEYGRKSSYPYMNLATLYMRKGERTHMLNNFMRVGYYPPSDASDYWGHGDQLVAQLVSGNREKVESEYRLYDAFAPPYARTTLLETLRDVVLMLEEEQSGVISEYIDRLSKTIGE